MNNGEIIKKAIEVAVQNGWNKLGWPIWSIFYTYGVASAVKLTDEKDNMPVYLSFAELIFSHDFAKAFFGDKLIEVSHGNWDEISKMNSELQTAWHYNLQKMVLEENPIKYLEKFL